MTHAALKRLVRAFRDGILDGKDPEGQCFTVSWPLETYLRMSSIPCKLIKGATHDSYHVWLELQDGTIIDATASQFRRPNGRAMPLVYVGERPEWYDPEGWGKTALSL